MSKLTEIERQIKELETRREKVSILEKLESIDNQFRQLKTVQDDNRHRRKCRAYAEFMESKRYVESLQDDVKATGDTARDIPPPEIAGVLPESTYTVKQIDGNTYRTFDKIQEGHVLEIKGHKFLVKSFVEDFAGNVLELLPLHNRATVNGKTLSCHFAGNRLTVPSRDGLKNGDPIEILGRKYIPVSSFLNSRFYMEYELAPAPAE